MELIGTVINYAFIIVGWILFFGVALRLIRNSVGQEKTVRAVIVDKQHFTEQIIGRMGSHDKERFVLVFKSLDGKRFLFYVSEATFVNYNVSDRGKLTYKGTKFIDFK